jgi:hypothetical protein
MVMVVKHPNAVSFEKPIRTCTMLGLTSADKLISPEKVKEKPWPESRC